MPARTLMVVDDDDDFRETLRDVFEDEGYVVVTARNGEEALRVFRDNPTEVVITDILMPRKEGVETIFELRRQFGLKKIIAMSGGGRTRNEEILETAKRMGVARVFKKPIGLAQLVQYVGKLVDEE